MKIALISVAKPETGTGNGTTEYAYQLSRELKKLDSNRVDTYYALKKSKKNDIAGLVYLQMAFPRRIEEIAGMDYDIIHITIQELGFAARILKQKGTKAKIITTVHDLTRLQPGLYKGVFQQKYNWLVKKSISDAMKYSDLLLFNSSQTEQEVRKKFGRVNGRLVRHGTRTAFTKGAPKQHKNNKEFTIGYVGAFATHKNVASLLDVAEKLNDGSYRFLLYGTGVEFGNVKEEVKKRGIPNVALKGHAPEMDIVKVYDSFDAFVVPSSHEGLSHQILEAQARGLPVLVYKSARIPIEITRYCIKADGPAHMAAQIKRLRADGYGVKRQKMVMDYARKFTWKRTALDTFGAYKILGPIR